jgi:L-lactate dehydrogenase complex protein LldE
VVALLERLGWEVDFPEAQTCCGQMHTNTGYRERGLALARRFERVFADADVVVSPSASCVAYLRENGMGLDGRLAELTEFLVDRLGVEDVGATFPHKVTLHPTCHSVRLMGIGEPSWGAWRLLALENQGRSSCLQISQLGSRRVR